jgi:hypothetical protein
MSGGWGKPSKMFNDFFGSSKVISKVQEGKRIISRGLLNNNEEL